MEIKEQAAERVLITKPAASKPSCSFRSLSEILAAAINASASPPRAFSEIAAAAIMPKTASQAGLLASCSQTQVEVSRAAAPGRLFDSTTSTAVYKPLAKVVSKSTVSLLPNMGNFSTSPQHAVLPVEPRPQQPLRPQGQHHRPQNGTSSQAQPSRLAEASWGLPSSQNTEQDQKSVPAVARPSYDGYNWRKYGQKQVKGSECPRSYYKCTHPNCPVKKKVERSFDGQIAEIVYKGEHNHVKPQPPKKNTPAATAQENESEGTGQDFSNNIISSQINEMMRLSGISAYQSSNPEFSFDSAVTAGLGMPHNSCCVKGDNDDGNKGIDAENEEPKTKRRKSEVQPSDRAGTSGDRTMQVPKIVVQGSIDTEIVGDGYRWRKYGQKVVKGNPYPRSYYRCTSLKCNVRKHVERASEDPKSLVTTYEGKHNHEMQARSASQAASEQDS